MREGTNWLVFGFCIDETVIDFVDRTGVETLMDGRLLRAAGLISKSAITVWVVMVVVTSEADYGGRVGRRRQKMPVPVASGLSARRRAIKYS